MKVSKQIIVIRKDLNMRKGKMVAQGSHAVLKAILDLSKRELYRDDNGKSRERLTISYLVPSDNTEGVALEDWLNGKFTKICVSVNSEAELLEVYNQAKDKGLICSLITDAGLTEFNGVPTLTCCSIGPAWSEEVDEITGKLPLL